MCLFPFKCFFIYLVHIVMLNEEKPSLEYV
ncbi:hypothetical protein KP509_13G079200 [Ceratopteris richardii]|uniref:Uncharacterized protein n=1 Tax=Ceratopteris richardii TaxID=49495 RepID=A0A8T2TJH1_CERRI|nr:hypothetical protein KP509_13G079200 [Ceratopteris richardii]